MEERDVLTRNGFAFKKKFGQNFLSDQNLLRSIVLDAGVTPSACVLEIGAGAGALTRALSERAKRVLSYEIDRSLQPVLSETLSGCENVEVAFRDFSKENLKAVEEELGEYLVVANLPYYLTTPLILRFVEEGKRCLGMTVMIQEEVAARFCAEAGSKAYGAVTAAIARRGECRLLRKVSRNLFTPMPNVDSAVVKLDFTKGGFEVKSAEFYRKVLRCAFGNRRKTLQNNLTSSFSLSRAEAERILERLSLPSEIRGEALRPFELGALSDLLFEREREIRSKMS